MHVAVIMKYKDVYAMLSSHTIDIYSIGPVLTLQGVNIYTN